MTQRCTQKAQYVQARGRAWRLLSLALALLKLALSCSSALLL